MFGGMVSAIDGLLMRAANVRGTPPGRAAKALALVAGAATASAGLAAIPGGSGRTGTDLILAASFFVLGILYISDLLAMSEPDEPLTGSPGQRVRLLATWAGLMVLAAAHGDLWLVAAASGLGTKAASEYLRAASAPDEQTLPPEEPPEPPPGRTPSPIFG